MTALLAALAVALGAVAQFATGFGFSVVCAPFLIAAYRAPTGASGPPVALFAVNARWPVERARPTMQVFFLGLNVVTLAALGWPDRLPLGVVAGFAAGLLAGAILAGRLPEAAVRRATLTLAGVGSVLAIVRGLSG